MASDDDQTIAPYILTFMGLLLHSNHLMKLLQAPQSMDGRSSFRDYCCRMTWKVDLAVGALGNLSLMGKSTTRIAILGVSLFSKGQGTFFWQWVLLLVSCHLCTSLTSGRVRIMIT